MKMNIAVAIVAMALLSGCNRTLREFEVDSERITLGVPIQVQPPGAHLDFFSTTGQNYVVSVYEEQKWWFEVRSYDGTRKYRQEGKQDKIVFPLIFLEKVPKLVCTVMNENKSDVLQIITLDWNTRAEKVLVEVPESQCQFLFLSSNQCRSPQQDAIFVGSGIQRSSGELQKLPVGSNFVGWQQNGDFVVESNDRFVRINKEGKQEQLDKNLLENGNTQSKGQLSLELKQSNAEFKNGSAQIGMLWLKNESKSRSQEATEAILVGSGYDLDDFGFVPNRQAIFFSGSGASFVVPYGVAPVNK